MSDTDLEILTLARAYRDARSEFDNACNGEGLEAIDAANRKIAKTASDLLRAARETP